MTNDAADLLMFKLCSKFFISSQNSFWGLIVDISTFEDFLLKLENYEFSFTLAFEGLKSQFQEKIGAQKSSFDFFPRPKGKCCC